MSIRHFTDLRQININGQGFQALFVAWNLTPTEVALLKSSGITVTEFGSPQIFNLNTQSDTHLDLVVNYAVISDYPNALTIHDALDNMAVASSIDPGGAFALTLDGVKPLQTFNDISAAARAAQQAQRSGINLVLATLISPDGKQYEHDGKAWIDPEAAPKGALTVDQDLSKVSFAIKPEVVEVAAEESLP